MSLRRSPGPRLLAAVLVLACAGVAAAQDAGLDVPPHERDYAVDPYVLDPPRRALWHARDGSGPNWLVPALEVPAVHLVFWSIDKAWGADYAQISTQTIATHLFHGPWEWDHDIYFLNEFGHPYHGALLFSAARSSGLGFWASVPYAVGGAAVWELAFETDPPSKNDMITTPMGGIVFGEVLHRISLLVLDEGDPGALRSLAAFGIEPVGGINRTVFGRRQGEFFHRGPYWAHLSVGVNFNVNNYRDVNGLRLVDNDGPQLHLGAEVLYGLPGDPGTRLRQPFDHFVLSAELDLSSQPYGAIFSRGLVLGSDFRTAHLSGLWGLFAGYDYASPGTLRVAAVNLGVGSSAQVPLGNGAVLLPTVLVAGVPFGAGGGIATPVVSRDYHYGPGAEQLVELQLVRPGVGRMAATARGYLISGEFVGEGVERIGYLTVVAELMVFDGNAVGMEAFVADRRASYENSPDTDIHQRASQVRFYWSLVLGDAFDGRLCAPGR